MIMRHEAMFYADDEDYLVGVREFIDGGLAAGDPVLVAVPAPRLQLIRRALGAAASRVRLLDMARAGRNPGRIIPAVLHAFVSEHAGRWARIIGEPIWPGRPADVYPRCVQHEALINLALADRRATILCPYDIAGLEPAAVADAVRTHPFLVESGTRRASDGYTAPESVVASFNRPLPEPSDPPAVLIFDTGELPAVRRFVVTIAELAGMRDERLDDLLVAVNELATNAVTHGLGPATLRVWRDGDGLVCEVRDGGQMTDVLAGRIPPAHHSEGGRGLMLVNLLSDAVHIHTLRTSTTVRFHMAVNGVG
ncbi:anti-sigma factor RsbA family regulatory protein [Phytohabitans rumicis]|uniref:Anti-sigma regulatory factor n=1 Tax=Phytohabitans rumicis TaxID=1076125 RepID=A0A6V8LE27_9ACTN|nr:anti-sigma factor RsbA family regulatory protein [Phytohabitans rumicis]GFJ92829.1 anti-sigma regulatory factor [Phytohabitans rumicis]